MTTYWLSTPRFTVCVVVNGAGIITETAPYLRRTWLGRRWTLLHGWLERRYGNGVLVERLHETLDLDIEQEVPRPDPTRRDETSLDRTGHDLTRLDTT